jgi:hypothetical protein
MPYRIRKAKNVDLYFVSDFKGKKYSNDPVPKEDALKPMRALYASEGKEPPVKKTWPQRARYSKGSELAREVMKQVRDFKKKPSDETKTD